MINSVLIKQGYRVGKFLSPHLIEFNERISINNKQISDKEIEEILRYINPVVESYNSMHSTQISHFDIITCMAFVYFAKNNCDFILLETGMGGKLDSTNVALPMISIITSIGYDHMKNLGNTLTEIAEHKAGIIKPNSDTIFLELENEKENEEVLKVIKEKCKKENNKLHFIKRSFVTDYKYDTSYQYFNYNNYLQMAINLKGKIQVYNAAICLEALNILKEKGIQISTTAIISGLKNVINPGRFEILMQNPTVIYDGAHNVPAIENFLQNMKQYYSNAERVYILSILKKKDYNNILKCISKDKKAIIFLTSGNDSTLYTESEELYETGLKYIEKERMRKVELEEAVNTAIKEYPNSVIAIAGTLYVYGDVLKQIKGRKQK